MGILGKVVEDIFDAIEDLLFFMASYTLIIFILGGFFGAYYKGTEIFWWPLYLLAVVLFIKIVKDAAS